MSHRKNNRNTNNISNHTNLTTSVISESPLSPDDSSPATPPSDPVLPTLGPPSSASNSPAYPPSPTTSCGEDGSESQLMVGKRCLNSEDQHSMDCDAGNNWTKTSSMTTNSTDLINLTENPLPTPPAEMVPMVAPSCPNTTDNCSRNRSCSPIDLQTHSHSHISSCTPSNTLAETYESSPMTSASASSSPVQSNEKDDIMEIAVSVNITCSTISTSHSTLSLDNMATKSLDYVTLKSFKDDPMNSVVVVEPLKGIYKDIKNGKNKLIRNQFYPSIKAPIVSSVIASEISSSTIRCLSTEQSSCSVAEDSNDSKDSIKLAGQSASAEDVSVLANKSSNEQDMKTPINKFDQLASDKFDLLIARRTETVQFSKFDKLDTPTIKSNKFSTSTFDKLKSENDVKLITSKTETSVTQMSNTITIKTEEYNTKPISQFHCSPCSSDSVRISSGNKFTKTENESAIASSNTSETTSSISSSNATCSGSRSIDSVTTCNAADASSTCDSDSCKQQPVSSVNSGNGSCAIDVATKRSVSSELPTATDEQQDQLYLPTTANRCRREGSGEYPMLSFAIAIG